MVIIFMKCLYGAMKADLGNFRMKLNLVTKYAVHINIRISTSPYAYPSLCDDQEKQPILSARGIPEPFSEGVTATCVEAVWQGLKVSEVTDIH